MYYVYILRSRRDSKFYAGLTKDLSRRIKEHNAGHVKPTKARGPFVLVYSEKVATLREARKREKFFKSRAGRELRDTILKKIPR